MTWSGWSPRSSPSDSVRIDDRRHRPRPPAVRLHEPGPARGPLPRDDAGAARPFVDRDVRLRIRGARPRGRRFLLALAAGAVPRRVHVRPARHHRRPAAQLAVAEHPDARRRAARAVACACQAVVHPEGGGQVPARDAWVPGAALGAGRRPRSMRLRARLREALPGADDRDGRGRAARGCERTAPPLESLAAAIRRDRRDDAARGAGARSRGVRRVRREAGRGPPAQSRRRPRVRADRGRAGRRPAVRRGMPGARARRAERRRRHHAEPALTRRAHVRGPIPTSGSCWRATRRSRRRPRRRSCATSPSPRSPRA